ncbi:hypothetical protein OPIT5_13755 [Opitutaceae bacterium TAV5]|nr:hypothetical protein OPIT5_13755 [Opitutaceae bacterium TAV5]
MKCARQPSPVALFIPSAVVLFSAGCLASFAHAATTIVTNESQLASGEVTHVVNTYDLGGGGLTLGAGDTLGLGGYVANTGNPNNVPVALSGGPLVIDNGGVFDLQQAWKNSNPAQGSVQYNTSALTLNSGGIINFGAASTVADRGYGAVTGDFRLLIGGNLNLNGGTLSSSVASPQLWLKGGSNVIRSSVILPSSLAVVLNAAGSIANPQALTSEVGLGRVLIRYGGNQVTALSATGVTSDGLNVDQIQFYQQNSGASSTLKLESDLATRAPTITGGPASGNVAYTIDTNGHTFDITASNARFEPGRPNGNTATTWNLSGGGVIDAHSFRFNLHDNVSVNIGANTTLVAHANNVTNSLGTQASGTVDATSTFIYAAADSAHKSFLNANVAIGKVVAEKGIIDAASDLDIRGGLVIQADGVFDAKNFTVTTLSYTFGVDGIRHGKIAADNAISLTAKDLVFDFAVAPIGGETYSFFTTSVTGTANSVSVTFSGTNALALVNDSGIWSATLDGLVYSFDQSVGSLAITAAVPEPAMLAVLMGVSAFLLGIARRRMARE